MLQVNFIIIYIIHEILVLFKITRIFKHFLRIIIEFYSKKKKIILIDFFLQYIMMKSSNREEANIIEDVRNLFRLKNKQMIWQ